MEWLTDSISTLGIPLIAIALFNAGPFEMGVLYALGYLAYPLLGLFAGVWVDRWRRKPVLVWTNITQVLALASIPLAYMLKILSLYQLFLVTLIMSVTIVFFNMAYTAYLPTLIDREDLVEGNSKLEASASVSAVVGPALASGLFDVLGAALSVAVDAIGTLIATIAILSIRKPEPPVPSKGEGRFWNEMRDGLRSVTATPSLRTIALVTSILNVGNSMFYAVFLLYIVNQLKISEAIAPIIFAVGAVGSLMGAAFAPVLLKRVGFGRSLVVALLINGIGRLLVQVSVYGSTLVLLSALWMIASIGVPIYNVNQVSFRQAIIPDELQGRMNATMRTLGYGAATVGAFIGGILGSVYGIMAVMTGGATLALLPALLIHFGTFGKVTDTRQS